MEVIERTRDCQWHEAIDCSKWLQFMVIQVDYRYVRIQFQEIVDKKVGIKVESPE